MRFLLMIHEDESRFAGMSPDDQMSEECREFVQELKDEGVYVTSQRLQLTSTAVTVRVRDGKMQATDGPFVETKEQLGGFHLIEVPDVAAAVDWAAKVPSARRGSIEIRPIWVQEIATDEGA